MSTKVKFRKETANTEYWIGFKGQLPIVRALGRASSKKSLCAQDVLTKDDDSAKFISGDLESLLDYGTPLQDNDYFGALPEPGGEVFWLSFHQII